MPYSWEALEPDHDTIKRISQSGAFSLIVECSSFIQLLHDFRKPREAVGEPPPWYGAAHVLVLIFANIFPNPIKYGIDVISGSTQKTLVDPVDGLTATNNEPIYNRVAMCTSNDMAMPDHSRYGLLARIQIKPAEGWSSNCRRKSIKRKTPRSRRIHRVSGGKRVYINLSGGICGTGRGHSNAGM